MTRALARRISICAAIQICVSCTPIADVGSGASSQTNAGRTSASGAGSSVEPDTAPPGGTGSTPDVPPASADLECANRALDVKFCDAEAKLRVCKAGGKLNELPCSARQRCTVTNNQAHCGCEPGTVDQGAGCLPGTSCDVELGGCDPLTECKMVSAGERTCGICPGGYLGDGTVGCSPQLRTLTVSCGMQTLTMVPGMYDYTVRVSVLCQQLQLTASGPDKTTLTIDGAAAQRDAPWTSGLLRVGDNTVRLELTSEHGVTTLYTLHVQRVGSQQLMIKASNADPEDCYGFSVAASGDSFVTGSLYEDSASASAPNDNSLLESGAAYVYVRNGASWVEQQLVKPDIPLHAEYFGTSVAMAGDTLVVGAPSHDAMLFYAFPGTGSGAAYVFQRTDGKWTQVAKLTSKTGADGDLFGFKVAIQGDTIMVGAPFDSSTRSHAGAVYVYSRGSGTWPEEQKLVAAQPIRNSGFGWAIAIDQDNALIGASQDPTQGEMVGSAYAFVKRSGTWQEQQHLPSPTSASNATFGWEVALRANTALISAARVNLVAPTPPGEVYIFERQADVWAPLGSVMAAFPRGTDLFGSGLALLDDGFIVGANGDNSGSRGANGVPMRDDALGSGAVHIFSRQATGWQPSAYLKANNTDINDSFGQVVALTNDALVIGAAFESSPGHGVDADGSANGASNSGAVYVYQ